jgi:hypothetical protein
MSGRHLWAFKNCMPLKVGREYFKRLEKFINNEYFEVDK